MPLSIPEQIHTETYILKQWFPWSFLRRCQCPSDLAPLLCDNLWFILSPSCHTEIVPAGLERPLTELLPCYWNEVAKRRSDPAHIQQRQQWVAFACTERAVFGQDFEVVSLVCLTGYFLLLHCPREAGGIYWEPKTLKPPEKKKGKNSNDLHPTAQFTLSAVLWCLM